MVVFKKISPLLVWAIFLGITPAFAQTTTPTQEPTPSPTISPTPTPVLSPTASPTPTVSPTPTPEPTISPEEEAYLNAQRMLEENQAQQEGVRKKIDELKEQEASLANEIVYQESQIELTGLQIEETLEKITALKQEIEDLGAKIARLEETLEALTEVTTSRIVATYVSSAGGIDPVILIFQTEDISDFVSRYKYFRILQQHDKKLLKQMQATRDNYDQQREVKREKQTQAEALEEQLENQKDQLAVQKEEKERLLEETKNDEQLYQEKLAALLADEETIKEALQDILARIATGLVGGQPVKRGQIVGSQGNTGNVFPRPSASCPECGSHLHFMILTCGDWECAIDPEPYLAKGEYARPLSTWYVTQRFGPATCSYCGYAFHNGIDLVYDGEDHGDYGQGAPIYALADGEIYRGTDAAGGKYAIIKHSDDLYSAYWHLQ
jgi:peptidoglycan hydrolase CwlO-like protein